jgi:hypothetical protein
VVYLVISLIVFSATLPMPPIPPPLMERSPGPAVPPRVNLQMLGIAPGQLILTDLPSRRSAAYHDVDEDFEPQFLRQTPSGTIYIPQGILGIYSRVSAV